MTAFNILSLYDTVFVSILEEWIVDVDLCYLDTAVCNHALRAGFKNSLSRVKIVNSDFGLNNHNERFEWVTLRGMELRTIRWSDGIVSQALESVLKKTKRLIHIDLPSGGDVFVEMVNEYGLDVLSCTLNSEASDADVLKLLKVFPNLTSLNISACTSLSEETSSAICRCCPYLVNLIAPDHLNIASVLERCTSLTTVECGYDHSYRFHEGLKEIRCTNQGSSDVVTAVASACPNLEKFLVNEGKIADLSVMKLVQQCRQLTSIQLLCGDAADVSAFAIAASYKNLRCIALSGATDEGIIAMLSRNNRLTKIDLSYCTITDKCLIVISECCMSLTDLNMRSCGAISEIGLFHVTQKCKDLRLLVCDERLESLPVMFKLAVNIDSFVFKHCTQDELRIKVDNDRHLKRYTAFGTNRGYEALFAVNPGVQIFAIVNLDISNDVINSLVVFCPQIQSIVLRRCNKLTRAVLPNVAKCKLLTVLVIEGMSGITENDILTIVRDKPNMREVSLLFCPDVRNNVIAPIAKYCPALRSMWIFGAKEITSSVVITILESCPRLDSLSLNCASIDGAVLIALRLSERKMRYLNIAGCNIPTDVSVSFKSTHGHRISDFHY